MSRVLIANGKVVAPKARKLIEQRNKPQVAQKPKLNWAAEIGNYRLSPRQLGELAKFLRGQGPMPNTDLAKEMAAFGLTEAQKRDWAGMCDNWNAKWDY